MSIIEIQIRTQRFCELVKAQLNSRVLSSPTIEELDDLKGKLLEKIECVSCFFDTPSEGSGAFIVAAKLAFKYHDNLQDIRDAGSFKAAATAEKVHDFKIKFRIVFDASQPQPPVLTYQLLAFGVIPVKINGEGFEGRFPIDIPADLTAKSAAIEASEDIVAIRIGTNLNDAVHNAPIDRIGEAEWIQRVPGDFIAETVRSALDRAIDAAIVPPPAPDPNKPWLPKPKPRNLQKGEATGAIWMPFPTLAPALGNVLGNGEIIAVDACPLFDVDVSVALQLSLHIDFPNPHTMKKVARLTWDADSTWCDVWLTVLLGVPVGIGFHIGAEDSASESILGKSLGPGDGFVEAGRTDDSIVLQKVSGPPSPPSRDFDRTHSEVTDDGVETGGLVRPKAVGPVLAGEMIPATAGLHIDCNIRGVSMVFNPAQVVLRNSAAGRIGPPPRVFLEKTVFVPANAWSIRTDMVNKANPHNADPQTVLTFVDPPTGRLAAGTSTSVFLFTDFGARWVDLGEIPLVPQNPPVGRMN